MKVLFSHIILLAFIIGGLALRPSSAFGAEPKKPDPKDKPGEQTNAPAPYDRICHVDVSVIWKATSSTESDESNLFKEYFASVSEQGFVAEEIQNRLKTKLTSVRAKALRNCIEDHQNPDSCIAKKLIGLASDFPKMDYGRRGMLLDSARLDCGRNIGKCVATEVSEMKCWMNIPPETVVPNEPKVEIAQPGNTEPPIDVIENDDAALDDEEAENLDEIDVNSPNAKVKEAQPIERKKKKKRKKAENNSDMEAGKGNALPGATPEPKNPYSQPFSLP